jgi:uncharacterized protein (TIGR02147 family)
VSIDIYQYEDFRKALADLWRAKCEVDPDLTHRAFAKAAGFSNPGFLGDVLRGRRKLSEEAVGKMVKGFALRGSDAEFFRLLVKHNQAKASEDREEYWRQILTRRSRSSFVKMNPALSRYYQDHRYPLVRAALQCLEWKGDGARLGAFVDPPLAPAVAAKLAQDLVEWGLVKVDAQGVHRVTDSFVEPPATMLEQVRQLNRTWISQGAEAIGRFQPSQRHVSTILLTVSESTRREVERRIEKLRQDVFELLRADQKPDRIHQLSIQFFPRSRAKESL